MSSPASRPARLVPALVSCVIAGAVLCGLAVGPPQPALDKDAQRWVDRTFKALSLEQKVGQLFVPNVESTFISSDSDTFDELVALVRDLHVGALNVAGGSEPVPGVLLNPTYGSVILGQPLHAASVTNRIQQASPLPLLTSADFEWGAGMRIASATSFPRAMAFGAAGDEALTFEAGRIIGVEARAIGIHVNFAPVVDVNNNPRNPVINTRSFGEDPAKVGALASAYLRGLRAGGALSTLKHFPGHGDTDVDSHLGLPVLKHPRERLEAMELPPFKAAMTAGSDAVMIAHIELPALDPSPNTPATLSRPIVTDFLRGTLAYDGLVYTDSMSMDAVAKMMTPAEAAVRAVKAGNDFVLHSPDPRASYAAVKSAVERAEIDPAQIDASVKRILRAKARLGLHKNRLVSLEEVPAKVGTRAHQAVADEISQKSITLIQDERQTIPLSVPPEAAVLYLSILDYPSNWRISAPSRTFVPELRSRWRDVTAVELSDRSTPNEIELVRAMAPRFDAIVAGLFVRTSSGSGRMDLAPPVMRLLRDISNMTAARQKPFVSVFFGNPYAVLGLPELPAVMLTYDFHDRAERSAVRALAGEAPITGRLPVSLPGRFPVGHGLERTAGRVSP